MRDQRAYGKTDILGTDAVVSEVESINRLESDRAPGSGIVGEVIAAAVESLC
jgi:hypothetical protein